jgi:hypothetical protein
VTAAPALSRVGRHLERLPEAVSAMLGEPVELQTWTATEIPYASGSPATGGLRRVRGRTRQGRPWSIFLKVLQHPRHWPGLTMLPPHVQAAFLEGFPWRAELAAWEAGFADRLPGELRLPALYLLDELGDDRLGVWMEDVATSREPWNLGRFRRAARALGGLAARRSDPELIAACRSPRGSALRQYVDSRIHGFIRPLLDDDATWRHPVLRADLWRLYGQADAMLDQLDLLPQAVPHGDASPQNLLVPAAAPDTFVVIDIGFATPHAVGFDLGQLLVGLAHAGQLAAAALPRTHEALVPSYLDGYRAGGGTVDADQVLRGYVLALMLRSGFTSLPFEALGGPTTGELYELARDRAALTRFIIDLSVPIVAQSA